MYFGNSSVVIFTWNISYSQGAFHLVDWKQGRSKNFSKEGGGVEATMFHTHGAHGTYQFDADIHTVIH